MENKEELEGVTETKVAITLALALGLLWLFGTHPEIFTAN